jgi:beta-lactamase regulating signal transducer with metallopeptidase domain
MTMITPLVFSLIWGALVWLLQLAANRRPGTELHRPSTYLALIVIIAVPSLLAGMQLPVFVENDHTALLTVAGVSHGLSQFAAPINVLTHTPTRSGFELLLPTIGAVYFIGLAIHLLRTLLAYRKLANCVSAASPLFGFSTRWPVLVTQQAVAPFAFGGRNPVIVMPSALLQQASRDRIALVIDHEETHLRCGDPGMALALTLVSSVFWFNPAVRDLVSRWGQSCELRADAAALNGKAPGERKAYAETLLAALRLASGAMPLSASFSPRNSRSSQMRLSTILKGGQEAARSLSLSFIAGAGIGALAMIGGVAAIGVATAESGGQDLLFVEGGSVTVPYGVERKNLRIHTGIDIRADKGASIAAPEDARVTVATDRFRDNWRWGKAVVLQTADGLVIWFTHLDGYSVKVGDQVKKGDIFATVGNTGLSKTPHLHIETYKDYGRLRVDPADIYSALRK